MDFDAYYRALGGSGPAYSRIAAGAFGAGEAFGQQGLMSRRDTLLLADRLHLGPAHRLLDVPCGPGGPGRLIGNTFGCSVVGVDFSVPALRLARSAHDPCFHPAAADASQLPFVSSSFHAALVLDSMSAFASPPALLHELARVLEPNGRLGLTAEVGQPLGHAELSRMPPGPAYVLPEQWLIESLERCGFRVLETADCTSSVAQVALRLADGLARANGEVSKELGSNAVRDLSASLKTWGDLFVSRRVRELMIVAELRGRTPT